MKHFFELTIHDNTWSREQIIEILRHDGIVSDGVVYWGLHQDTKSNLVRLNTHKYSDFHNYEHTFNRYDLHRASKHRKEESKIELTDKNYFDKICTLTHTQIGE